MKLYQLSKTQGKYWWTGTVEVSEMDLQYYQDDNDYVWTTDIAKRKQLNEAERGVK